MTFDLQQAIGDFFAVEQTDARRIFHGRGQLYPGLEHICLDWFSPVLLITAYRAIEDVAALLATIRAADKQMQVATIILQKRYLRGAPAELLSGAEMANTVVTEGSLLFEVHPGQQQNAGLFLDMRPLRDWLQQHARGKNVLNLFAYTCSLSVAALAGGASKACNVDISKTSIKWGEQNHRLNQQGPEQIKSIPYNLFRSWGRIQQYGRYDLVLIDPPSRQRGAFDVEKNYGAVLRKLSKLCSANADVIATINSPFLASDYLLEQFEKNAPEATLIGTIPAAPEFADKYPERGLKICHFRMG
jgi:23S rRNA (cytosine1962-C5)-methyltransferase